MACVRAIVDIASAIELQGYRLTGDDDGREVIDILPSNAPLQHIMNAPSPFLSPMRLREMTTTHYLIYGNALWHLERPPSPSPFNPKPPVEIRIIHPEDVMTVYVNNQGYPVWYLWRDTLGYTHTSPVTDIVHFRDLNAKGLVFGYPRAASALNDIIGDDEASQFVRQTVTNSGAPLSWALVHEDTTLAEAQAAEAAYYEKMVVRGNRGRFTFLGGVKDIKSTSFNLRDLEFPDLRRVSREDICAAFGVDPRIVGIASASSDSGLSGNQYTEARVRLVQQTVEPMLRYFESELNFWFAPEYGDVYLRYDPDTLKALVEDDDRTSTRVQNEVKTGLRTIEEGREALDLPSDYEIDDTLAVAMGTQFIPTAVAVSGVILAKDTVLPPNPDAPNLLAPGTTETDDGSAGAGDASTVKAPAKSPAPAPDNPAPKKAAATPALTPKRSETPSPSPSPAGDRPSPGALGAILTPPERDLRAAFPPESILTRGVVLTPEQRRDIWKQFDERATSDEASYKRAALMLFSEERSNIARVMVQAEGRNTTAETALDGVRRQLRHAYKPGGEVVQRWTDRYHPLIGETFAKGGAHVSHSLNRSRSERADPTKPPKKNENAPATSPPVVQFDFHLTDPHVQQAIRDRSSRLAENVGATTGAAIDDALRIALREGLSITETANLIDKVAFGLSAAQRALTIARTETVGALNQGQFMAAADSGQIEGKEWLTQGDGKVRDSHAECEGEGMIAMDDTFSNGCNYPGDPDGDPEEVINCRCSLLYYNSLNAGASSPGD